MTKQEIIEVLKLAHVKMCRSQTYMCSSVLFALYDLMPQYYMGMLKNLRKPIMKEVWNDRGQTICNHFDEDKLWYDSLDMDSRECNLLNTINRLEREIAEQPQSTSTIIH